MNRVSAVKSLAAPSSALNVSKNDQSIKVIQINGLRVLRKNIPKFADFAAGEFGALVGVVHNYGRKIRRRRLRGGRRLEKQAL